MILNNNSTPADVSLAASIDSQLISTPLLVDSANTATTFNYTDLDDIDHTLAYASAMQLQVSGNPNTSHTVKLASPAYPNREPELALLSNTKANSSTYYQPQLESVNVVNDSPLRHGLSYQRQTNADQLSQGLTINNSQQLQSNAFTFAMALKPLAEGDGQLLNINNAIIVERLGQQLLVSAKQSDEQIQTLTTTVHNNQWHTLGISINNQQLSLEVNGLQTSTPLSGTLDYSQANGIELLNSASNARISNISYTYWQAPALTTFTDGSESKIINLNTQGQAALSIATTGQLSASNPLYLSQVAINNTVLPIVLSLPDNYINLAGVFVDAFGVNPTHNQVAALYSDYQQYGDAYLAASRLLAMVADDTTLYRESSAVITALALLHQIEGFEHLKASIRSLQKFFVTETKPALVYAAIDRIALPLMQAIQGQPQALQNQVLPLTILAEILDYDIEVARYMAAGIQSAPDLNAWFDHFTKPLDGWPGLSYRNPDIDATDCDTIPKDLFTNTNLPMASKLCRQTGQNIANWIRSVAFDQPQVLADPQGFVEYLNYLNEVMHFAPPLLKKQFYKVFDQAQTVTARPPLQFLIPSAQAAAVQGAIKPAKWLAKLGSKRARYAQNFLMGKSNHRLHPVYMLFIYAYLDSRTEPGFCDTSELPNCKPLEVTRPNLTTPDERREQAKKEIERKIKQIRTQVFLSGELVGDKLNKGTFSCTASAFTHGEVFELEALMLYHLMYELGDDTKKILDIEQRSEIEFGQQLPDGSYLKRTRLTDIVITGDDPDLPTWLETKSLQAASSGQDRQKRSTEKARKAWLKRRIIPWNLVNKGKSSYQRQYMLDQFALNQQKLDIPFPGEPDPVRASQIIWWFDTWDDYELRIVKRKNDDDIPFDPGVPLDAIGTAGDTEFHRLASKLAEWTPRSRKQEAREHMLASLSETINGKGLYFDAEGKEYIVPPNRHSGNNGVARLFSLANVAAGNLDLQTKLREQLEIPPEVQQDLDKLNEDFERIISTMDDVIEVIDTVDVIPEPDVDEYLDKFLQWTRATVWFEKADCDP